MVVTELLANPSQALVSSPRPRSRSHAIPGTAYGWSRTLKRPAVVTIDMSLLSDELAGVVDLFGGLTREELQHALEELAFKRGEEPDAVAAAVEDAVESYHLVPVERDDETLLVAGPVAFPTLPEHAEDLPHIMAVEKRTVDRETAAVAARDRLDRQAVEVAKDGDSERAAALVDICYDLETWAAVDTDDLRERLDDV